MKFECAVLVYVALLGGIEGKRPCCVTNQWEAVVAGENASVAHGRAQVVGFVEPKVSADFLANKLAAQELISSGSSYQNLTWIADYKVGSLWVIEWFSGHAHCVKYKLPAGTKANKCMPSNWKYMSTLKMGLGSNTLTVDNFVSPPGLPYLVSILVTSDTCMLVTEYVLQGGQDSGSVQSFGVFNVTPGIKDRSVFKVPDFCPSSAIKEWNPDTNDPDSPQPSDPTKFFFKRFTSVA